MEKEKGALLQTPTAIAPQTKGYTTNVKHPSAMSNPLKGASTYQPLMMLKAFPQAALDKANIPPLFVEPKSPGKSR